MSLDDKIACSELIHRWAFYRDQARWENLAGTFCPEATIGVSWFSGYAVEFVALARANFDVSRTKNITKHLIWPSVVETRGDRAVAETSVQICARQLVEDFYLDYTTSARFYDRLERHGGQWRLRSRTAIYEKDRVDAVDAPERFADFMANTDFSGLPQALRYIGSRLAQSGRRISPEVHIDGTEKTAELYRLGNAWLSEAA